VRFTPVGSDRLAATLAEHLLSVHDAAAVARAPLRVGLDGPRCAQLGTLAVAIAALLTAAGRPVGVIAADSFYRDASVRLEYGHHDVDSFYDGWLDHAALRREALRPAVQNGSYLPSLRDPHTNRATRATPIPLAPAGFLLLHGELLLGTGLELDLTIHTAVSRQARRRQTETDWPDWVWTLPAFDRYELDVNPMAVADVVLRWDDRNHPAISFARPPTRH
jgi:uridine kinase